MASVLKALLLFDLPSTLLFRRRDRVREGHAGSLVGTRRQEEGEAGPPTNHRGAVRGLLLAEQRQGQRGSGRAPPRSPSLPRALGRFCPRASFLSQKQAAARSVYKQPASDGQPGPSAHYEPRTSAPPPVDPPVTCQRRPLTPTYPEGEQPPLKRARDVMSYFKGNIHRLPVCTCTSFLGFCFS